MSFIERAMRRRLRNTSHKATTLVRYYLFECTLFSVCLHKFLRDDNVGEFHNHPFAWVSFFLGSYIEQSIDGARKRRWFVNWGGQSYHRVEDTRGRWTLVLRGREKWQWDYKRVV